MTRTSRRRYGVPARSMLLAILLAFGCAPLPPVEPLAPRAWRPAPPTPYAKRQPEPRSDPRPSPSPTHRGQILDEQDVGETAAPQPDEPPANLVKDDESAVSLAPQIKAAKAPNVAAALRMIDEGRVLINQQRYDQALGRLQRAVSIDPSNFYGYYYLAKAHQSTHDYSQAVAFANRATALGAQAEPVWLARAYTLQGEIFEGVGRFPDARIAYQRAFNVDPTNLVAYVGKERLSPKDTSAPANEDSWR